MSHHPPVEHRSIHRRNSAVPGDIDLETGNLLGYNKAEGIKMVDFYIMLNFVTNIILLLGKSVVAILTSSISIVASLIDSALDFLSTGIIYLTNKLAQSKSSKDFPIGKNRLEPIGVLVFSIIIIISFIQVGIEAVNRLIHDSDKEIVEIGRNASIIMLLTIALKLACYLYGNTIESSGAEALAQDALVDVVFNSFSLLMPLLGYHFQIYWFDPLGAVLLSVYVVTLWCQTSLEHIIHLTGHKADPNDYRTILYLCMRFSEKISKIKDINCYYVGDSINVEIDVILDNVHDMRDSHDLAEALQYTLEALPMINIERAFVHTDYEVDNFKGHLKG
jgi:cation diffusion facilitator family transporter